MGYNFYMDENHDVGTWHKILEGSVGEVSPAQIAVIKRLTVAQRFQMGCSISNLARHTVGNRIRQRNPNLSQTEAERLALQGKLPT